MTVCNRMQKNKFCATVCDRVRPCTTVFEQNIRAIMFDHVGPCAVMSDRVWLCASMCEGVVAISYLPQSRFLTFKTSKNRNVDLLRSSSRFHWV